MKLIVLIVCLLASSVCSASNYPTMHHWNGHLYTFLPDPGEEHAVGSTYPWYENDVILEVTNADGTKSVLCKGPPNGGVTPAEFCDYWTHITYEQGKVDRDEALWILPAALGIAGETAQTAHALGQGCIERNPIFGESPSPYLLAGIAVARIAYPLVKAHQTPLRWSTARNMKFRKAMVFTTLVTGVAIIHNAGMSCSQ